MTDTYYRADLEGKIVLASGSATSLLGYSTDELLGRRIAEFYVEPEIRDEFLRKLEQCGGKLLDFEAALRRKDGRTVWVSTHAQYWRDGQGNVAGVEGTVRDITERRRAEAALRDSEARFRAVVDNSPLAIFLKDREGRYLLVNKQYETWFDTPSETIIGKTIHDLFRADLADHFAAYDREVLETGNVIQREVKHPVPGGAERDMLVVKFPVRDLDDRVTGIGVIYEKARNGSGASWTTPRPALS
jgi:PAS domain S-box-containing protein